MGAFALQTNPGKECVGRPSASSAIYTVSLATQKNYVFFLIELYVTDLLAVNLASIYAPKSGLKLPTLMHSTSQLRYFVYSISRL